MTSAAAQQVQQAIRQGGAEGMALRLAAVTREDGSLDYRMGFDEVSDDDISITSEGIEVVMEPEYAPLLDETLLDFARLEGEEEPQFIFINPKDANYAPPQGN
ncbi:iron-sulfur cluster biosynthesis family protein [Magnetovirga frankeli]|uniref:iron-sulfur cluster biosynthesis family protein n=1 Tax=Magnetovirga frankeli TaxID=947516 RepID=UPI003D334F7F